MNTNTRDLGIGAGKGDKSRVTSANVYRARFPDGMGSKRTHQRSACCEAPVTFCAEWWNKPDKTVWWRCMACQRPCGTKIFKIT